MLPMSGLRLQGGLSSWDFFDKLLNECHVVGTPGSGFGPAGRAFFVLVLLATGKMWKGRILNQGKASTLVVHSPPDWRK